MSDTGLHVHRDVAVSKATGKRRPRRKATRRRPAPVAVRRAGHPLAEAMALWAAGGDRRRLKFCPDGAVIILNHPRPAAGRR